MQHVWSLDPASYTRHPLHSGDRVWPESNCSVDVWIELLHTAGLEPTAALPFTFASDFEGDQWTFFKFPPGDLAALYGIEIIELNIWRRLIAHLGEQVAIGRPCIVEVDAYYLPDTAGTSYRADHVKTSIAVQALDPDKRRAGYFHNAGYYELEGDDFADLFQLDDDHSDPKHLPPYAEAVKFGDTSALAGRALVWASIDLLSHHLSRAHKNAFRRYGQRIASDLHWLAGESLPQFHAYAFATFRQFGAAFELGAAYLRWLEGNGEQSLEAIAAACDHIATTAKALQFRTARLVNTHRTFDPFPFIETMASACDEVIAGLKDRYSAVASAYAEGSGETSPEPREGEHQG